MVNCDKSRFTKATKFSDSCVKTGEIEYVAHCGTVHENGVGSGCFFWWDRKAPMNSQKTEVARLNITRNLVFTIEHLDIVASPSLLMKLLGDVP